MEPKKQNKALAVLLIVWGALSYLIFLPSFWWLGLVFAGLAVIVGGATLRRYHAYSIIAMLLAIVACLIFLAGTNAGGRWR